MKKTIMTIVAALALSGSAMSQESEATAKGHHIYVGARGGASSIMLAPEASLDANNYYNNGSAKAAMMAAIDVDYAYFWGDHWGVRTGLHLSNMMSKFTVGHVESRLENIEMSYPDGMTGSAQTSIVRMAGDNVTETFNGSFVEVPLQMAWQGKKLFADFGVKIGLPIRLNSARRGTELPYSVGTIDNPNYPDITEEQSIIDGERWSSATARCNDGVFPLSVSGLADLGIRRGCACGSSWMFSVYGEFGVLNTGSMAQYYAGSGESVKNDAGFRSDNYTFSGSAFRSNEGFAKYFTVGVKVQYDFAIGKK